MLANFTVLTPNQSKHLKPVAPEHSSIISQHPDNAIAVIIQRFQDELTNTTRMWCLAPKTCRDPQTLNSLECRIYDAIVNLRQQEKLDPTTSYEQRQMFLSRFNWESSQLTTDEKAQVEHLLVKNHNTFARHRLDIGMNIEFKVRLTWKHDDPVYAKSLPTPTNLKDAILVKLASMQEFDVIPILPFSRSSPPIFAQRKHIGKFRLLLDLRRINHFIRHHYDEQIHPVKTIAHAVQLMAGKSLSVSWVARRAIIAFRWQMSNQSNRSSVVSGLRTFADKRLTQGLNRSFSAFTSLVRE